VFYTFIYYSCGFDGFVFVYYFLYFLLNRSECEPVFSITRMSSWLCCSSFYLLDQIVQTVVLVHTSLVEVAQ